MSFFGFDTGMPPQGQRRSHNAAAPGFAQPQDAFAGFSGRGLEDQGETLDFDDTYDGLGDQLEETGDDLNDDTFGGDMPVTQQAVGKDFDFFGQTNKVADAMREEQMTYNFGQAGRPMMQQPQQQPQRAQQKPARTGYEGYIPQLQANASIWGTTATKTPEPPLHQRQPSYNNQAAAPPASRKIMTLDEIEASMRAQSQSRPQEGAQSQGTPRQMASQPQMPFPQGQMQPPFPPFGFPGGPGFPSGFPGGVPPHMGMQPSPGPQQVQPMQILQRPAEQQPNLSQRQIEQIMQQPFQGQLPQRGQQEQQMSRQPAQDREEAPGQPRQILQNPNRLAGHGQPMAPPQHGQIEGPSDRGHQRGPSYQGPIITSPQQILQLSAEDRAMFLEEEARRAKRNHKIAIMAKYNGMMTPQDKNYISRIQLTQLMSASGILDDQSQEAKLSEDFYYQVHSQIRGGNRMGPNQPANTFAQTYLFQTGNRYGGGRRFHRNGDNHMQRMQQQVQRAVEAAKSKPKNKQLNFEGSLGTIAFSNSKAPRPMLNIKSSTATEEGLRPPTAGRRPSRIHDAAEDAAAVRRAALKNIENTFRSLMLMEDHERNRPPRLHEGAPAALIQAHMDWREKLAACNAQLWSDMKVMDPVNSDSPSTHPFIALLSFAKGKKLIPRVWRHIDEQQRLTIITLIAVHIDSLDVVAHTIPSLNNPAAQISASVREEIDLFNTTIIPTFFVFLNEAQLPIIIGLLGLILDRSQITNLIRTKTGVSILTMLISRVELLKSSAPQPLSPSDLDQWQSQYNRLFDLSEPALPYLFGNSSVHEADDVHIWQFLAAMGAAANPEQQQRLVMGVKERVMETVGVSKNLPAQLAEVRLGHVNLFMRAIGLDVELLG